MKPFVRLALASLVLGIVAAPAPQSFAQEKGQASPELAARYFRTAEAESESGNLAAAASNYRLAADADRNFDLSARIGFEVLARMDDHSYAVGAASDWLDSLVESGRKPLAEETLQKLLKNERWTRQPNYNRLLISLTRYFSAAEVGPDQFKDIWEPALMVAEDSSYKPAVDEIRRIFSPDHIAVRRVGFEPGSGVERFRSLLGGEKPPDGVAVLSAFVSTVGDGYLEAGNLAIALQLHALAWTIDTTNVTAGLYLADELLALDSSDSRDALRKFIGHVFEEKQNAYLGEDWRNIQRFHTLLGTIYVDREQWGGPKQPRSAIFQLENALAANGRLGEELPVPGVRALLAVAYDGAAQQNFSDRNDFRTKAAEQYLRASEDAIALGRTDGAKRYLEEASISLGEITVRPIELEVQILRQGQVLRQFQ